MNTSPYQTPASNLVPESKFKRSVWWKIYFFFITILTALGMFSFMMNPDAGAPEYMSLIIWIVATTGLFGYVFLKPIFKPKFWLYILIADLIFSFAYYFMTNIELRAGMSDMTFYIANAFGIFITLPEYYALYDFSKIDNPVWKTP
jgi:hypothetical protein